jgi:uncharacterized caspase-like protein
MFRALALVFGILAGLPHGNAAERVALVIGNGAYGVLKPALPNPANDAVAIAAVLDGLGFEVDVVTDASKETMEEALARLAIESRTAEVTLFYFAGHGLQDQGRNYLAPVDAALQDETDLRRNFVRLDDVLDDLASADGARILLLDACRDNDAVDALRAAVPTRSAGVSRGLARVPSVEGQLVAFATQPDRVADDGVGSNSPFTTALVKHLATPGVELRTSLTRVRVDVAKATNDAQVPEVWDSVLGEIYLSPAEGERPAAGEAPPEPQRAGPSEAQAVWGTIGETQSVAVLKAFIARFPDTFYADLAAARLAELEATVAPEEEVAERAPAEAPGPSVDGEARLAWDAVKDSSSIGMLETFAARYPDGFYADLAWARVAELKAEEARRAEQEARQTAAVAPPERRVTPSAPSAPAQSGGDWFVILGSFPQAQRSDALSRQSWLRGQGIDAQVIDTDAYPNLTDGLYAIVLGPFGKAAAEANLPDARRFVGDAYVKSGY